MAAYASFDEAEPAGFKPRVVLVDAENQIVNVAPGSSVLPRA